jgi:delta(3,5)-delta(2,4)-dienoyl-CoA isomerase
MKTAMNLANLISSKSPIAVSTSKRSIVYSRDHSVEEGLQHIALLNSSMLQTDDLMIAA